jgi:hypothetical protein
MASLALLTLPPPSMAQEFQQVPLPLPPADILSHLTIAPMSPNYTNAQVEKLILPQPVLQQKSQEQHAGTSNDGILWTMPNFLTLENAGDISPLTPGQKFKVVARDVFDPFEFVLVGCAAGLGLTSNSNPSYGQGPQGYAKRYGTSYADNAIENFMSSAVFPTMLHQDPRTIN